MASLEDYLRNFAKAGSGFAFPSGKTVDLESFGASTGAGSRTYVAPANGYLALWVNATAEAFAEVFSGYACQQLSSNPSRRGLDALSLVGRGKSVNTPCTVKGSFKERRCSFIPRVACNNARMEVAA